MMDDDLYTLWQELLASREADDLAKIAARLLGEVVTLRRLCGNLEVELSRLYGLLRERDGRRVA